jgi:hypothetical protein
VASLSDVTEPSSGGHDTIFFMAARAARARIAALTLAGSAVLAIAAIWPRSVSSHEVVNTTVTFDREIVRILNKKCIACHSENNLGIPLTSYEQVRPWARSIEEEVLRRHMPPWRAVAGYGQFANDIGLTNREVQFIVAWVEGNGPRTKNEQMIVNIGAPTPLKDRLTLDIAKWPLGKPDLLRPLVPPASTEQAGAVTRSVIDLGLTSDKAVRAAVFQPADRRNIVAAFLTVQETGQWVGNWTPWDGGTSLPGDVAFLVPAGAHLVAEIHHLKPDPSGDRGTIGLYFASAAPSRSPNDLKMAATPMPGALSALAEGGQKFTGSATFPSTTSVLGFNPEVRPGVQSIEISARKPDGAVQVLLLVRDPLPEWPTAYLLKEPVSLPGGTEIVLTDHVDQSKSTGPLTTLSTLVRVIGQAPNVTSATR